MKKILLLICSLVIANCVNICLQNPNYECGDTESCVLYEGEVKCCPFKGGNVCVGSNTCCPAYAPTCFSDKMTCGVGRSGAFEIKIQSELKPATLKTNANKNENDFFKVN